MPKIMWLSFLSLLSVLAVCLARDFTFTIQVKSGVSECFYEYIHEGAFLEIEYQVRISDNFSRLLLPEEVTKLQVLGGVEVIGKGILGGGCT